MNDKLNLKTVLPELKEVKHALTVLPEDFAPEIRGAIEAQRYVALSKVPVVTELHRRAFQQDSVAVLVDTTPDQFGTLQTIADSLGLIAVDAQGFYAQLSDIPQLQGSSQFIAESFAIVINRLRELAKQAGKNLPFFEAPSFETHANLSFEDNARGNLRKLVGKSGPDSTWVFLKAREKAEASLAEGPMVPVLVYNLKGATKPDYEDSFFNVEAISVDEVTEDSLKEGLAEVRSKLQASGKIQTKRKPKNESEQGEK